MHRESKMDALRCAARQLATVAVSLQRGVGGRDAGAANEEARRGDVDRGEWTGRSCDRPLRPPARPSAGSRGVGSGCGALALQRCLLRHRGGFCGAAHVRARCARLDAGDCPLTTTGRRARARDRASRSGDAHTAPPQGRSRLACRPACRPRRPNWRASSACPQRSYPPSARPVRRQWVLDSSLALP